MVGHLLAGELISSLLISLKQIQVKVAPAFADRAWQHLQMPWHWGLTAEPGLHAGYRLGEFSILEEVYCCQPRPEECPQHHCHLQTELPQLGHAPLQRSPRPPAQSDRSLGATLRYTNSCACPRKSPVSNLRVDLRLETPLDCQSVVVANACAPRLSILFLVNDTAELEADPAPLSTFFISERAVWVWLGSLYWLALRQRAQRSHACSPFYERFWRTSDQPK